MDDILIQPGDFIKLRPVDPYFWMMDTGMIMVDQIVAPDIIISACGNLYNLNSFIVVYLNGRDLTTY